MTKTASVDFDLPINQTTLKCRLTHAITQLANGLNVHTRLVIGDRIVVDENNEAQSWIALNEMPTSVAEGLARHFAIDAILIQWDEMTRKL